MKTACLALVVALSFPAIANAQSTLLQGGPTTQGHIPLYVGDGYSQPIVQDGGGSGGGGLGANPSEIGVTARSPTGVYPVVTGGNGPNGEHGCFYDAPTTNATGYHYLCLDANAQGGGLLSYGSGGGASVLPLQFMVNGSAISLSALSGYAPLVGAAFTGPISAPTISGNVSASTVKATGNGATTTTTQAAKAGQTINVKSDFGAAGNTLSYSDGTIASGTAGALSA